MTRELKPKMFFNILFYGLTGYMCIATFPGNGKFDPDPSNGPSKNTFFKWPEQRDDAIAYVVANKAKDLYIVPTLFHTNENRKAENAAIGKVAYADADTARPELFKLEPTMVVESSPGRYQLYWRLDGDDPCRDPEMLARASRRIAHGHAAEGCDTSGWDIGQLLRIPGSTNNKPHLDIPWTVRGVLYETHHTTLANVHELYPPVEPKRSQVPALPMPDEKDLPTLERALRYISGSRVLWELYSTPQTRKQSIGGRTRSERMWRFLSELSRQGVPINAAFLLAQSAGCNKYKQDGRPVTELWKEVQKAYSDPANEPPKTELDFDELETLRAMEIDLSDVSPTIGGTVQKASTRSLRQHMGTAFLNPAEQFSLPKDTIVDRYVAWGRSRTDAAECYQRAGILTVLGTVFSDFAYPATQFKMGGLNLWFMILGGTTRSRKSTARGYMLDTIEALEDDYYQYDLGSDATAEGLTIELAEDPGRSKLYNRDEVHGLFREIGSKGYMSGLKETLTELYDGRVRGRLRATSGKTKSTRTAFNMFLSGITEDVTETLELRDFGSGFLARFLFEYAEPPPRTRESVYMHQMDEPSRFTQPAEGMPGLTSAIDIEHEEIVAEIAQARRFWEELTKPGNPVPIGVETRAWARYNEFVWDAGTEAERHELHEVIAPTTDRLTKSVLKVACVLAMVEQRDQVEMRHIVKAISFAEEWFKNLTVLAGKVRESEWAKRQEEVEEALLTMDAVVSYARAYSKVRTRFRPREFDEIIEALERANRVTVEIVNGTRAIRRLER
jgi:hypothetical protein